jgi:hypothetical protein
MPDWCGNFIEIKGDKEDLEYLESKIEEGHNGSTGFMEHLIGLGDIPDNYEEDGWRTPKVNRFGTNSDFEFSNVSIIKYSKSLRIEVESAWTPIIPFLSTLCRMYNVTATMVYCQTGVDQSGKVKIDLKGNTYEQPYDYLEALYRNWNEYFWETVESFFELQFYDDYEEMIQSLHFVSVKDKAKIELLWNMNKYNL